jgi:hypothetical protein
MSLVANEKKHYNNFVDTWRFVQQDFGTGARLSSSVELPKSPLRGNLKLSRVLNN